MAHPMAYPMAHPNFCNFASYKQNNSYLPARRSSAVNSSNSRHFLLSNSSLSIRRMLILKENSFQFNRRHYLQTHGTSMGTKTAVAFANIFMAKIEKEIISKSKIKPPVWKRYIDDVFCLWDTNKDNIKELTKTCRVSKHD